MPRLNAVSGILLLIGYVLIRARLITQHRRCMIAAFATSSLFLCLYTSCTTRRSGSVRFTRQGPCGRCISHPRHARRAGGGSAAARAGDAVAGAARRATAAHPYRPLDLADLAVRLGDRRARLRLLYQPTWLFSRLAKLNAREPSTSEPLFALTILATCAHLLLLARCCSQWPVDAAAQGPGQRRRQGRAGQSDQRRDDHRRKR